MAGESQARESQAGESLAEESPALFLLAKSAHEESSLHCKFTYFERLDDPFADASGFDVKDSAKSADHADHRAIHAKSDEDLDRFHRGLA